MIKVSARTVGGWSAPLDAFSTADADSGGRLEGLDARAHNDARRRVGAAHVERDVRGEGAHGNQQAPRGGLNRSNFAPDLLPILEL